MPVRDPWLAVNLSWTLPGLGHLYAGRRGTGIVLLCAAILLWAFVLLFFLSAEFPVLLSATAFGLTFPLQVIAAVTSHRCAKTPSPADSAVKSPKSPWVAILFARFLPGIGHFYAGRWIRGGFFLALWVYAAFFLSLPEGEEQWGMAGISLFWGISMADAFFALRKNNSVGRRATVGALFVILAASQNFWIAKGIQLTAAEVYKIPGSSMEPTLLTSLSEYHQAANCPFQNYHLSPTGDRIVSSKLAYAFSPVNRFDLVVFRFPLNQSKFFVKRVVGMPDEEFKIYRGDLYVRPRGEPKFRIARRPLATQDSLWITPSGAENMLSSYPDFSGAWRAAGAGARPTQAGVEVIGGELATVESSGEKGIRFDLSARLADFEEEVGDVRLTFDFEITGPEGTVFAEIANSHGIFRLLLSMKDGSDLRRYSRREAQSPPMMIAPLKAVRLLAGRRYSLELAAVDGLARARLDGEVVASIPFIEFREDLKDHERAGTGISFGSEGVTFKARNLKVGRDIYYRGRDSHILGLKEDEAVSIPAGHYLLLGDNVANSHDSRAWVKATFPLKDGRKIVCEWQEVNRGNIQERLREQLGLAESPDYGIEADQEGKSVAIFAKDLADEPVKEPFRFIPGSMIKGKATKIWWPLDRMGPVR